jgi:hypothetical protein
VLTGMHKAIAELPPLCLARIDGFDDWRNFHKIWARAGNYVNEFLCHIFFKPGDC